MELTDMVTPEDCFDFEKYLFDRFYMNCTVYDAAGVGVTGKPIWCNNLCPRIKSNPDSLAAICATGNQNFMAQARKTRAPIIGECDAGLLKISVPIFVDGTFLGTAGGCGRLPEGGEIETFIIEKTTGLNEAEITELCNGLQTMTREQAEEMAEVIEQRLAQLVNDYRKSIKAMKAFLG